MDRTLRVRTPESIAFSYELAGLGSRFLAVVLDMLIQIAAVAAIIWSLFLAGGAAVSFATPIIVAVVFLVYFGYFIAFEAFWNGQTPGKKLLGLRVVRDGGYPLDVGACAIRNLIRAGEFAFGFYAISAVATVLSSENKRLGDLAAGTIVVRDARAPSLAGLVASSKDSGERVKLISDDEQALIDRFVARSSGMDALHRATLATRIARIVRPRVSRDLQSLDDEELLVRLSGS